MGDLVVDGEAAEGVDPLAVAAAKPMQHVNVVGGFLQQQAGGVASVGVPIFEVEVAAVTNKVTAPARFDFANRAAVY